MYRNSRERAQVQQSESNLERYLESLRGLDRQTASQALRQHQVVPPHFLYKFHGPEHRSLPGTILESTLWLSSPGKFNDPFDMRASLRWEGSVNELARHAYKTARKSGIKHSEALRIRSRNKARPPDLQAAFDTIRAEFGVACLSRSRSAAQHIARHPLLWSHYADRHQGVCLQFHVPSDPMVFTQAVRVDYSDDFVVIDWADQPAARSRIADAVLRKSTAWAYEDERRIVKRGLPDRPLPFHPRALVGLIFGCQVSNQTISKVVDLCRTRIAAGMPGVRLFEAKMRQDQYKLTIRRRRDLEAVACR
jgi:hypothetical protein